MDKVYNPVHWPYRITQGFGENPEAYARFGMKWHWGIDIAWEIPWDTPIIYWPVTWRIVKVADQWTKWYGKYVRIHTWSGNWDTLEFVLAHFSKIYVQEGDVIDLETQLGVMGTTGNSIGVHLHIGRRRIRNWSVLNYNNWYYWYEDFVIEDYDNTEIQEVEKRNQELMEMYGISDNGMYDTMIKQDIITIISRIYEDTKKS